MKLEKVLIENIKEYENNPRINDGAIEAVKNSIRDFGYNKPIVLDKNNVIIAGHTRLEALKRLGTKEVECVIADDLTEEQARAYRIADNKTGELAKWENNLLSLELDGLIDTDMTLYGFDDALDASDFSTDFELPDGEKPDQCQMSITFHKKQWELIEGALDLVRPEVTETFGNKQDLGNRLYEVIRQWEMLKK